jgi:hypothetical protein
MFKNNETAVEEIAREAREIVNSFFPNPPADIESSVKDGQQEAQNQTYLFSLNADGKKNYSFLISDRISPETRESYEELVEEMISHAPQLSKEKVELIVNVFANYQDILVKIFVDNYGTAAAATFHNASQYSIHTDIFQMCKFFGDLEFRGLSFKELDSEIKAMATYGTAQQKLTAAGLQEIEGPMKVFAFKTSQFSQNIFTFILKEFSGVNPHNHAKTLFQLNRVSRNICEALTILYDEIAIK